ncbi:GRAS family transcription factor [Zostera marina]|uniref:GRAS family transcription factor n=1 Tax=Zostera marina TaxID=29655 RepID=A0A0K9PIA2_ZOSMR|nr:GRAS family transcription factor [Zostera marina]
MAFIRHVDSSPASYYSGRSSSNTPNFSNQVFRSDNSDINQRQFEILKQNYPNGIPVSLYHHPQHQMSSGVSTISYPSNPYVSCFSNGSNNKSQSSFSSISHQTSGSISDVQTPEIEEPCYSNENDLRCKLQELERELFNDDEVNGDFINECDDMECMDDDWIKPMKNLLLIPPSPTESSSDSNSNPISAGENRTPKQLLFHCASAFSEGNYEEVSAFITEIRQLVSIHGDPSQRLAACLVEGLASSFESSGKDIYKALSCKEPPTSDRLSAMQILFEACPCFNFGITAANGAITEALEDEKKVHIIDFDINQGAQYVTLLQDLSKRTKQLLRVRITAVDDPESVQRSIGGLTMIGKRLEKVAEDLHIAFEFVPIASKTEDVTTAMLACRSDEALVVNFAYSLHHMPDESVSVANQRDHLLRMVKGLKPKLVTIIEQDVNTNTAPFYPRFVEVYNYYLAVFESLDATLPRDSLDRMNVERHCLAKDIINIVACEGTDRIERYEPAGKWRMRMNMAGFVSSPMSSYVKQAIRAQVKNSYCDRYKVKEEAGTINFGWEDKILISSSAWK